MFQALDEIALINAEAVTVDSLALHFIVDPFALVAEFGSVDLALAMFHIVYKMTLVPCMGVV